MPDQKVILITGSRKGIGAFLVQHYLDQGYRVAGCSRGPGTIESPDYEHFCLDVSDEKAVRGMFRQIRKSYGRLDALVNNAGVAAMNHALLTPLDSVRRVLDTNVLGTFLFCREAAKLMQRGGGGRIVNMTTVASPLNLEGEAAYAASKAAVEKLTQILAREFADFGVTVNAVGPSPIATDLISGVGEDRIAELLQRQAIKRMGKPADVANVIDFYLAPASDYVTGQILYLGGVG